MEAGQVEMENHLFLFHFHPSQTLKHWGDMKLTEKKDKKANSTRP